jgi:hypothetical protein
MMMPNKVILLVTLTGLLIGGCSTQRAGDVHSGQPLIQFERSEQVEPQAEVQSEQDGEEQVAQQGDDESGVQQENIGSTVEQENIETENIEAEAVEPNVMNAFSTLENKAFSDAQLGNQCLRTSGTNDKVVMGDCNLPEDQTAHDPMALWTLVDQGGGFYSLRNQHALDHGNAVCLKSVYASVQLEMGDCSGTATPKNYTSKRLWTLTQVGEHVVLENKYRKDLRSNVACLGVAEDKKTPVVVACDGDNDAERLWKFDGAR